jgi:hypothetical protein
MSRRTPAQRRKYTTDTGDYAHQDQNTSIGSTNLTVRNENYRSHQSNIEMENSHLSMNESKPFDSDKTLSSANSETQCLPFRR